MIKEDDWCSRVRPPNLFWFGAGLFKNSSSCGMVWIPSGVFLKIAKLNSITLWLQVYACEKIFERPFQNAMKTTGVKKISLSLLSACLLVFSAKAEVRLPNVFGSHMVMQRDKPLVVWGWARPREIITVSIAAEMQQVRANEFGEWKAVLPALKMGGPFVLKVTGTEGDQVEFEDVMIGEVWLCSGQSNMERGIKLCQNGQQEIAAADYPQIRLLKVARQLAAEPQTSFTGDWKVCTPQSVSEGEPGGFTAVGYFYGRDLFKKLGVPVGLIEVSWSGTRIEPWIPPEKFASTPALAYENSLLQLRDPSSVQHKERLQAAIDETKNWISNAERALSNNLPVAPLPVLSADLLPPADRQCSAALYDGMVHPVCPFPLRGVIWYQGENNHAEGMVYAQKMKALIDGWRAAWGEGDFPFYYVQLAPFNYGGRPESLGEFWQAQASVQTVTNTGMVVINDLGNLKNIHPANKQEVGRRLALLALAKTYGETNLPYSGPTFGSMKIEGDKIRVAFNHIGGGLASRGGQPLNWFEIMDADQGHFVKADAEIDGPTVLLSNKTVKHPVAMQFAWSMLAEPNLMNREGLPAGAFRAGTVPLREANGVAKKAQP